MRGLIDKAQRLPGGEIKVAGDGQAVVRLVVGNRLAGIGAGDSIDGPVVVTSGCELLLGAGH